jgi:hypothetical protein
MIIELRFDSIEALVHVLPEFVDPAIQIVEAFVLEPGGDCERNNDRQGNLNKRLLEDVCGCRIHLLGS